MPRPSGSCRRRIPACRCCPCARRWRSRRRRHRCTQGGKDREIDRKARLYPFGGPGQLLPSTGKLDADRLGQGELVDGVLLLGRGLCRDRAGLGVAADDRTGRPLGRDQGQGGPRHRPARKWKNGGRTVSSPPEQAIPPEDISNRTHLANFHRLGGPMATTSGPVGGV